MKIKEVLMAIIQFGVAAFLIMLVIRAWRTRIGETGWENFPNAMLDWFVILGSVGILFLIIMGIISWYKGRKTNSLQH